MRAALLVAVLLFASCVLALDEKEYQALFQDWTARFNKVYSSEEFVTRYNIFKANVDYINEWNSRGSPTVLGTTVFADLTNAEYRALFLGTRFNGTERLEHGLYNTYMSRRKTNVGANPPSVDWVSKGAVTPIKNQGQCGSCWSFSTTGSVEGIHFIATNTLVSLSEQNLMDCSTGYGNEGCDGGLMDSAFRYIIANKGIDTEASYPYTMKNEKCKFETANIGATISSYIDITSGSEADLETASVQQPISVAIDASHESFQLYTSGIYNEPACSSTELDHGVLVVGYGTSDGTPYWLVKNSWGTDWGQAGYIWMSKDKNNQCGIATMASYPKTSS